MTITAKVLRIWKVTSIHLSNFCQSFLTRRMIPFSCLSWTRLEYRRDFYSYLSGYVNEDIKHEKRKGKKKRKARLGLVHGWAHRRSTWAESSPTRTTAMTLSMESSLLRTSFLAGPTFPAKKNTPGPECSYGLYYCYYYSIKFNIYISLFVLTVCLIIYKMA